MFHPILYNRDSSGRIRIWFIEQSDCKYRTISGLQDGEKVTSEWTITVAKNVGKKNERTPSEQATEEIKAKYNKQAKTGYFYNLDDVDKFQYVEPMLAYQYKDYADKIDFTKESYLLQLKYNGTRCLATKAGLFSRKGERYISIPHIVESLKDVFSKYPDLVLDGELYNYELRQKLNELNSLVRKTKNISQSDLDKSREIVEYHIYDAYNFNGMTEKEPYINRVQALPNILPDCSTIKLVKSHPINNLEQMMEIYQSFLEDDQEGGILRLSNSSYEHKRSKNLLKIKPEDDAEAVIIAVHEGLGNWSGVAKTVTLDWNGKIFDATLKCNREIAYQVLQNKSNWINKVVTFQYNGLTGLSIPNFARVDVSNCLK